MSILKESRYLVQTNSYGGVTNFEFFIPELKNHIRASETSSRIGLAIGNNITYVETALEADIMIEKCLDVLTGAIAIVRCHNEVSVPVKKSKKRSK